MKLKLVVLTPGKSHGKVIPVTRSEFVIGTDPACHLRTNIAVLSPRHCCFHVRGNRVFLEDLKSATGTFLNGRQVRGEIEVRPDDRIKLGPLELGVQIEIAGDEDKVTVFELGGLAPGSTELELPPPATKAASGSGKKRK